MAEQSIRQQISATDLADARAASDQFDALGNMDQATLALRQISSILDLIANNAGSNAVSIREAANLALDKLDCANSHVHALFELTKGARL